MPKDIKRADIVGSSRSSLGKSKVKPKIKSGEAHQQEFINFLTKAIGDIKDVSISIEGNRRIPIKDLKKKIN
jgi:hypothetical protein